MSLEQWALPELSKLLPLDEADLKQIISYTETLPDSQATKHLSDLLGESPEAVDFISTFNERRTDMAALSSKVASDEKRSMPPPGSTGNQAGGSHGADDKSGPPPDYAPPPGPPPSSYAAPSGPPPANGASRAASRNYTNAVIEAGKVRARDEQEMQQLLQNLQFKYGIYNSEVEPEHETDYPCSCPIHQYQRRKYSRYGVQEMWSKAVMYPGERSYNDNKFAPGGGLFSSNPYRMRVMSPYGYNAQWTWGPSKPIPGYHAQSIHQTIKLNNTLNKESQSDIDAKEPRIDIWDDEALENPMANLNLGDKKRSASVATPGQSAAAQSASDEKRRWEDPSVPPSEKRMSVSGSQPSKSSKFSSFKKSLGMKPTDQKISEKGRGLRDAILTEERGRWPDEQWRFLVEIYQEKVGMTKMIADLRVRKPTQYLHLLRAGYFEPIPVAWATQASNPLKFSIESAAGWRGITPAWRGYEDTAEERLYWVLNHREGSVGMRMKPDFISEMNMARERMAKAVEPPPAYFAADDQCHLQHTSEGYSKQVMPSAFRPSDRPEQATDDTMILLDVSGSMDFDPLRPVYDQYLVTGYVRSTQPKNKDVAKAIIRRFADAMENHDHSFGGYDLTTFANSAKYIGCINHKNLDQMWRNVQIGGGTRVMTGWQKVKELHFQKHSESATHHPVYGWQAGPQTPILRLLLLLDGEATDMDEFELDLLGCSWAHVTIFLIGVDGCPHHHRHANELQRISDVNHHVSFVDAQGNCPERFVTHELLKRHLGYDISMQEFESMEELPAYTA